MKCALEYLVCVIFQLRVGKMQQVLEKWETFCVDFNLILGLCTAKHVGVSVSMLCTCTKY